MYGTALPFIFFLARPVCSSTGPGKGCGVPGSSARHTHHPPAQSIPAFPSPQQKEREEEEQRARERKEAAKQTRLRQERLEEEQRQRERGRAPAPSH